MKMLEKGKQMLVEAANNAASKSTRNACRLWVGQPKVPARLLEKEFQKDKKEIL